MAGSDEVEVFVPYDGRWVTGFEVAAVERDDGVPGVRLRRRSDGSVLPAPVPMERVRPARLGSPEPDSRFEP